MFFLSSKITSIFIAQFSDSENILTLTSFWDDKSTTIPLSSCASELREEELEQKQMK